MNSQIKKSSKKKKKKIYTADEEYKSCIAHIKEIMEELESSNFRNIREILGMSPSLEVEHALGTMVALAGSTKLEGTCRVIARNFTENGKESKIRMLVGGASIRN